MVGIVNDNPFGLAGLVYTAQCGNQPIVIVADGDVRGGFFFNGGDQYGR